MFGHSSKTAQTAEASLDRAVQIAQEAVKTAFSPSNGLSEQQAWAAALWAEASLEMDR